MSIQVPRPALRRFALPLALVGGCVLPAAAPAQSVPLIPLKHFFDNPEIAGAQISPDGRWLSYLKPYQGKLNIHVRPVDGEEERVMTADTARPVTGYFWSADSRYLLYIQDKGGNENFHVYSLPVDPAQAGSGEVPDARDLTPFENVRALIFAVPEELPDRILVGLNRRDPSAFDGYWLDIDSGELTLAAENPGRFAGWVLDDDNRIRLAVGQNESGGTDIHARDSEDDDWRLVTSYPADEQAGPIRFHPDGQRVYMRSNRGVDLARLVLLDLKTGEETPVESDPEEQVDLSGAVFSDRTDELLATVYNADTVRIYPKDEAFARDLARIREVHSGAPGVGSMTLDEQKWVISFDDPRDPGATYLYDRATGEATFLFRPRPWLEPETLAGMRPVSFEAADGLTIHGYLTLPAGVEPRNLPMVLLVHGGPWARDTWGYDAEAQLLANRGYAVLQVNYRGSTGYGKEFYNAAVKEFAGKMHTDLLDGVQWAVDEGIADPERVAIYGGSYGGYATLVGMTFTPEVFTCGVDYVGPSSLITLVESFPAYWRPFLEGTWFRFVGDPTKPEDREDMWQRSPLSRVDSIRAPLLIVQGANDPRVTKKEADQLALALKERGIEVRYLVAENEGHGFANPDNRLALYRSMELFLQDCLGGRAEPSVDAAIESRIAQMRVEVDTLTPPAEEAAGPEPVEVGVGDGTLTPSVLEPSEETRRVLLVQAGQEREVGTTTSRLEATEAQGRPALLRVESMESAMMGSVVDSLVVLRDDLTPVSHRSHNPRRVLALDFEGTSVNGSLTPASGEAQEVTATTEARVFDAGALDLLLRSLPLAEGYAARLPVYMQEAGGETWVTARVTGSESVETPAGAVEAWVVETDLAGATQRHWVARESRELLKQVIEAGPGVELRIVP